MLNESEYGETHRLYGEGMRNKDKPLSNPEMRFKELLDYYFEVS